jgi:hypothetical protein
MLKICLIMERQAISKATNNLIKVAQYLDSVQCHEEADRILSFIKIAQNATQSLINDVPGGFFLENLNNTAYGLKSGIGGYPGSGNSYWDANGGENARHVDLRNTMMGQEGMSAQDRIDFEISQWSKNQNDPNYQQWAAGQEAQIARDIEKMKSTLQNPNLTQEERDSIAQAITAYQSSIEAIKKARLTPRIQ